MSTRCQTCWNLAQCCNCPIPADECRFHHPRGRQYEPCTCGPTLVWQCAYCKELTVTEKDFDYGYVCEPCILMADAVGDCQ